MQVQAMFYVSEIRERATGGDPILTVELLPVTRNVTTEQGTYESPNVQWSKYTPGGRIELTVTAEGAQQFYRDNLGKDVPILFG